MKHYVDVQRAFVKHLKKRQTFIISVVNNFTHIMDICVELSRPPCLEIVLLASVTHADVSL